MTMAAVGLSSFYCFATDATTNVNILVKPGDYPPAISHLKERDIISESEIKITGLDRETYDSTAQVLKAAVSYTNGASAQLLALMAKILELKKTMDYFHKGAPELSICALPGARPSPEEMLSDLKKYSDPNQSEMIDRLLNFMQMGKFLEKYRELEQSPEFNQMMNMMKSTMGTTGSRPQNAPPPNPGYYQPQQNQQFQQNQQTQQTINIEQLKNMLTPEQRQMYESLMAMNQNKPN